MHLPLGAIPVPWESMKKLILLVIGIGVAVGIYSLVTSSRTPEPVASTATPEPTASATDASPLFTDGTYALVVASSSMTWEGRKPLIPGYVDTGTVQIESGSATVVDGRVTGGTVTVDLRTISTKSTGMGENESMMEKHIKSADFFDVEKYPSAQFIFTSLVSASGTNAYTVQGTLTLKGVTQVVTFPATLIQQGAQLTMQAEAKLDRTLWGLKYGSGKFFQGLGDKLIDDMFTVRFTAVGVKK